MTKASSMLQGGTATRRGPTSSTTEANRCKDPVESRHDGRPTRSEDDSTIDARWQCALKNVVRKDDKEKTYESARRKQHRCEMRVCTKNVVRKGSQGADVRAPGRKATSSFSQQTTDARERSDGGEDLRVPRRQHHRSESCVSEGLVGT